MTPDPQDCPTIREAKLAITSDLEKRYTDPDLIDYLHRATAVDPRFKSLPFLDGAVCDQVFKSLITEIVEHEQQNEGMQAGPSTEKEPPSSVSPPQKKTAMSELFGDLYTDEQHTKPLSLTIEMEISLYRAADSLHVDADPFQWWKLNQFKFPHLSKHAQKYLCVPGTSVSSERVFSTAGDIVNASRSRLCPENVDMLNFLQKNMKIKE
ncbi:E3 SUMO-protein ligase ZBED1-like [Neoarius graeffei]|uniref:E3 SUMO-protein ligase ZBED1-like n=1 Tax=Neoarius graeffei TaxID=443677 RepID=UPI00298BDF96|nr:E3 SUMO-protein ligase ZBED1-like [Neoarius graeffei]